MAQIRDISNYKILEKVGKGAFGSVFRAHITDKAGNISVAAFKCINLEDAEDDLEDIQKEVAMLANVSCPQLTQYYGSLIQGTELILAMEFMEGGSLSDLM
ncbi:unnamed protein product, partial [Heterosigma akashiwo]